MLSDFLAHFSLRSLTIRLCPSLFFVLLWGAFALRSLFRFGCRLALPSPLALYVLPRVGPLRSHNWTWWRRFATTLRGQAVSSRGIQFGFRWPLHTPARPPALLGTPVSPNVPPLSVLQWFFRYILVFVIYCLPILPPTSCRCLFDACLFVGITQLTGHLLPTHTGRDFGLCLLFFWFLFPPHSLDRGPLTPLAFLGLSRLRDPYVRGALCYAESLRPSRRSTSLLGLRLCCSSITGLTRPHSIKFANATLLPCYCIRLPSFLLGRSSGSPSLSSLIASFSYIFAGRSSTPLTHSHSSFYKLFESRYLWLLLLRCTGPLIIAFPGASAPLASVLPLTQV